MKANNSFNVVTKVDQTLTKAQMIIWSMKRRATSQVVEFCKEKNLFSPDTLGRMDLVLYSGVIKRLQSLSPDYLGRVEYNLLNSLLGYYFKICYFEKYCLESSYGTFLKFTNNIIGRFGVSNSIIEQSTNFQELCLLVREAPIHPKMEKLLELATYLKNHGKTAAIICEPSIRQELLEFLSGNNFIVDKLKEPSTKKVNRINFSLMRNELNFIFLGQERDLKLLLVDAVIYYQPNMVDYEVVDPNLLKFFIFLSTDKRLYENDFKNDWKSAIEGPTVHQLELF